MNVFKKRPLSLILCIMLGGFSLFVEAGSVMQFVFIGISLLYFVCTFIFKGLTFGRNVLPRVAALSFALSVFLAFLFSLLFAPKSYVDKECIITGEVTEVLRGDTSTNITIKTESINDEACSYNLLLSAMDNSLNSLLLGDKLLIKAGIEDFSNDANGFNQKSYYYSRGYTARIVDVESIEVTYKPSVFKSDFLTDIRQSISSRLKLSTNKYTGGFLAALIMGDITSLDPNTKLNYSLIGISHILALSGMHLVLICEALRHLLKLFKLNKKLILLISTLFCLFYMAVTGFSASVVRSAIMLTITNGLFLLTSTHDSYTTLPLSVFLIILFQPHAVYDVSLWLSAFATLGVIVFGEITKKKEEKKRFFLVNIIMFIWESILATIFAVGASYFIMLSYFNTVSFLAPITTLIFSVPINFLIFAGIALLILDPIIPFGGIIIWITDTINELVEVICSWKWAIISLDYVVVEVLIVIFVIYFFAILVLSIDKKRIAIAIMIILFMSSSIAGVILTQSDVFTDEFSYKSGLAEDTVLIKQGGQSSLVYAGSHSSSSAYRCSSELYEAHLALLDDLVLTRYDKSTIPFVSTFIGNLKTERLLMPAPKTTEEKDIATKIAEMLMVYGTDLKFYIPEAPIEFGDISYRLIYSDEYTGISEQNCLLLFESDNSYYAYLSDGITEGNEAVADKVLGFANYVIFGGYGSGCSYSHEYYTTSSSIKAFYYTDSLPLSERTVSYYKNKKVPIIEIGTFNFKH